MGQNTRLFAKQITVGSVAVAVAFPQKMNEIRIENTSTFQIRANTDAGLNSGAPTAGSSVYIGSNAHIDLPIVCSSVTCISSTGSSAAGINVIGLG